jgi:hypothetical protein
MAARLKSRDKQCPNGFTFYDAATRYRARPYTSFTVIVQEVIQARLGNPAVAARLSTNPDDVAYEVDRYIAEICRASGWNDYVYEEGRTAVNAPPFHLPQNPGSNLSEAGRRLKNVAAGSKTILEWIASKEQAVLPEISERRAGVCAACPKNEPIKSLLDHFEAAAAAAVQRELHRRADWQLITTHDAALGVCGICHCVNALSVHCPLELKLKHMPAETRAALPENCWVIQESKTA